MPPQSAKTPHLHLGHCATNGNNNTDQLEQDPKELQHTEDLFMLSDKHSAFTNSVFSRLERNITRQEFQLHKHDSITQADGIAHNKMTDGQGLVTVGVVNNETEQDSGCKHTRERSDIKVGVAGNGVGGATTQQKKMEEDNTKTECK